MPETKTLHESTQEPEALATHIGTAMCELYKLQMATLNSGDERVISKYTIIFTTLRASLFHNWEDIVLLLKDFHLFGNVIISLQDNLNTSSNTDEYGDIMDVLITVSARLLTKSAQTCQDSGVIVQQFEAVIDMLEKSFTVDAPQDRCSCHLDDTEVHESSSEMQEVVTGVIETTSVKDKTSESREREAITQMMIGMSKCVARPDGRAALKDFAAALSRISISLDIIRDVVDEMTIVCQGILRTIDIKYIRSQVDGIAKRWSIYEELASQSAHYIMISSDAIMVEPRAVRNRQKLPEKTTTSSWLFDILLWRNPSHK